MFCITFVSDHNTDFLMLHSVQLKNVYSYLNSSLKLSDIVLGTWGTVGEGGGVRVQFFPRNSTSLVCELLT